MLSAKVPLEELDDDRAVVPTYANRGLAQAVPRYEMPEEGMEPDVAYQLIHDELALDGNPILNLATFVTTWMDDQADRLMGETMNKNAIDWDEYPQTVELQDRCVNMLARLFGAPEHHTSIGMRHGRVVRGHPPGRPGHEVALARPPGRPPSKPADKPNLVMGANVQVCWEKFARYFDVEPRYVPLTDDRFVIGVDEAMALVDENTIGVVGILGSTYTGEYEPIAALERGARRAPTATRASTCRSTSTRRAGASWRRSSSPTSPGTSACPGSARSTCRGTSTGSSTPASAGWSGATSTTCPRS